MKRIPPDMEEPSFDSGLSYRYTEKKKARGKILLEHKKESLNHIEI